MLVQKEGFGRSIKAVLRGISYCAELQAVKMDEIVSARLLKQTICALRYGLAPQGKNKPVLQMNERAVDGR